MAPFVLIVAAAKQLVCILILLSFLNAFVVPAEIASFQSVSFPALNANIFKPVQVKNFVFIPPFDSPMLDFCAPFDEKQNASVKLLVSKAFRPSFPTRNMVEGDCFRYFCTLSNETNYEHYNATQRMSKSVLYRSEFAFLFNHCFLCDSTEARAFREAISTTEKPTCREFPATLNQMVSLMNSHCISASGLQEANNLTQPNSEYAKDGKDIHFGVMDGRFFDPTNVYSATLAKIIPTNPSKDNLSHFLNTMFPLQSTGSVFKASEIPMFCHCGRTNDYTFRCYDINHMLLTPYRYYASPILFLVISIISSVFFFLGVVLPRVKVTYSILTQKPEFKKDNGYYFGTSEATHIILKYLRAIWLVSFGDIKFHSIFWNSLLLIFMYLVEITYFARAFTEPMMTFSIDDTGGTIRAISFVCLALCFCSMIVHWSHTLDLIKKGKSKGAPSILNGSITLSFYLFMIAFLVIGLIVAVVTNLLLMFFFFLSILYTVLSLIFCVVFTIVGVTILIRLRKGKTNVLGVKLTKSTMVMNGINFLLVIAAGLSMPTFFIGWDMYTVEFGLLRGTVFDVLLLAASNCVTYILYTPLEGKTVYGEACSETIHRILNCECFSKKKNQDENNESIKSSATNTWSGGASIKNKQVEHVKTTPNRGSLPQGSPTLSTCDSNSSLISNENGSVTTPESSTTEMVVIVDAGAEQKQPKE